MLLVGADDGLTTAEQQNRFDQLVRGLPSLRWIVALDGTSRPTDPSAPVSSLA